MKFKLNNIKNPLILGARENKPLKQCLKEFRYKPFVLNEINVYSFVKTIAL